MSALAAGRINTYVLVDAENIDWAVSHIIGRKPEPQDRVQFDKLVEFCAQRFTEPVKCIVALNVRGDTIPDSMLGFIKALRTAGCEVAPLYGRQDQKVVDLAILKLLAAIGERPGASVVLASHDGGDFASALRPLLDAGGRQVAVLGFREYFSQKFRELQPNGLQMVDLELDAHVFSKRLPRLFPIKIDEFDAAAFL
jgi:putative heme uptake system protein